MRRWPTLAGTACVLAFTQAMANEVSLAPQTSAKPHQVKAKPVRSADLSAESLGDISFSDPYAPPVGGRKAKGAAFLLPERAMPADPQGGFSISVGREAPGEPMTGGFKFRF